MDPVLQDIYKELALLRDSINELRRRILEMEKESQEKDLNSVPKERLCDSKP